MLTAVRPGDRVDMKTEKQVKVLAMIQVRNKQAWNKKQWLPEGSEGRQKDEDIFKL